MHQCRAVGGGGGGATLDARSSLRGDWPAVALDYGQLGGSVRWCGSFSVPDVGSHVPTPLFHAATGSQACALCSAVVASEFIVYSLSGRPFGVCSSAFVVQSLSGRPLGAC